MKQVSAKQRYSLGNGTARLTIAFGDAQMGISRLLNNGALFKIGLFEDFDLGQMKDRTLSIKSTVTDINNQTNNVSVVYLITGGQAPLQFGLDAVAEAEGKSVDFNCDVDFV